MLTGIKLALLSVTNTTVSGSEHKTLFLPHYFLSAFVILRNYGVLKYRPSLGNTDPCTCRRAPGEVSGFRVGVLGQGQCLPVLFTEHLLQWSPNKQMFWPYHNIYNYLMMHSQKLIKNV